MPYLIFILWLVAPPFSGGTTTVAVNQSQHTGITVVDSKERARVERPGFRSLAKRLLEKDWRKAIGRSNDSDGKWLAISGLILGLLVIASWIISPYLGIFTTIPLGLIGLALSLFGLRKARRWWHHTKFIQGLSIAGIILNGLLVGLFLALLAWSSS